jgi:hypothetical protein
MFYTTMSVAKRIQLDDKVFEREARSQKSLCLKAAMRKYARSIIVRTFNHCDEIRQVTCGQNLGLVALSGERFSSSSSVFYSVFHMDYESEIRF